MIFWIDIKGCKACVKFDFKAALLQKGYRFYSERGNFWKVDTINKSVFGAEKSEGKVITQNNYQSWSDFKNLIT